MSNDNVSDEHILRSSELFGGTHEYYAKYRPSIPQEVIDIIVDWFSLKLEDRILDLGCGTGQVALAMEGKCAEIVCLDIDPEMLNQAKIVLQDINSESRFTWINRGAEELSLIKDELGVFKAVTISRAFHWMNQEQVLSDIDDLISDDGGIAILGDKSFWSDREEWQRVIKSVIQKYLGEERRAGSGTFKSSSEPWENVISQSSFKRVVTRQISTVRYWNVESITGWLFSSSFASSVHFGDQTQEFQQEIEKRLLDLNPSGSFREDAVFSVILASRDTHQS